MFKAIIIKGDIPDVSSFPENYNNFPQVFVHFQKDYYETVLKNQYELLRAVEKKIPGVYLAWSDELVSPDTKIPTTPDGIELLGKVRIDSGLELYMSIPGVKLRQLMKKEGRKASLVIPENYTGQEYTVTQVLEQLDEEIVRIATMRNP